MRKLILQSFGAFIFFQVSFFNGNAQTIFTYGDNPVSKQDFLKAYTKNNSEGKSTEKSYKDYLELYIRYKLKVKAAYDLKLDTLSSQTTELKNFRNQVADTYMNDEESLNKLVNEAYDRSLKDIHLAYIFVAAPQNATPADTLKASQKINNIFDMLKKGKDFGEEATAFSDDASAKYNHGDIGWINVFTLPYELETLAYTTPSAHFSKPFRAKGGYLIFKNLGERKAFGKIKVAQILLGLPPNAADSIKEKTKAKADSVYEAVTHGANFGELARKYSSDNLSYQTGGEMAEFGVGKYEPSFEEEAFSLNKEGEISKPVLSMFGYHIIKLISKRGIPEKNKETMEGLKQRIKADSRINVATKKFLDQIFKQTNFKKYPVNEQKLSVYTDSILQHRGVAQFPQFNDKTVLFSINKKDYTVKDWINYVRGAKTNPVLGRNTNIELLDKFIEMSALTYYREHLEEYNKDFAFQLKEFKEGNLLFEVMQRKIWDKASVDSAGLKNYYNANKDKYWWQPGADAIMFTCTNEKAANEVKNKLQDNFSVWRKLIDSSNGSAQADSGRFELAQLPMCDKKITAGQFTSFTTTPPDNTVSFAYIIKLYTGKTPRTFEEARGFVINDYQNYLEDKWITELKQKYPVKVNEPVLKSLPK
ncbi:MAG TPA: peptidylprolyl isomerase [Puia sp.]|nr:peptidylprolyl isomerase [Puia sp.]